MSPSKPAAPDPTEIAGRYVVERKLGAGAFGTVFKAKDKILGRMVAIKTIRLEGLAAQGASMDELLQRFTREAQVSAKLKHPGIVTIYDIGNADGMTYLAMEFIDGKGLERIILDGGPMPVERAASLAAQVAQALDFAHKNGVVHRDIKPANIMIEAGDRVKVTDFGIAKVTESADHLTMTGSLLGTPSYMSPEQARGAAIDGRSDLFSVGCVLYELLAGKKAFRGESITALIFKIITEEPPPIRELAKDVPDEMVRIVQKALAKTADARYQTGDELAADLLQLTRPGSAPTLRASETPTVPGQPAAAVPTLVSAPTNVTSPTLAATAPASLPTQMIPPVPAPPKPPAPPAPPTPPPAAARPAARPTPPAPAARKSGGGAGLLIGIGVVGLFFVAAVLVGGWWLFMRKGPGTETPPVTLAQATPVPATPQPPASLAAEATPLPPTDAPSTAPPATTPATAPPASFAPPATAPPATTAPVKPPPREDAPPRERRTREEPAPDSKYAYLDVVPPETDDGTEAGSRVAGSFSGSGSSSGSFGTSRRFQRRERNPRPQVPPEGAAIATLRHLMTAQDVYSKRNGRYGSLAEIGAMLDVAPQGSTFQRKGYRFEMTADGDSYRVVAMPLAPGARPFTGDESGFIRPGVE
jgi:serine/threonine-protein kinase